MGQRSLTSEKWYTYTRHATETLLVYSMGKVSVLRWLGFRLGFLRASSLWYGTHHFYGGNIIGNVEWIRQALCCCFRLGGTNSAGIIYGMAGSLKC